RAGYEQEAGEWRNWLLRAIAGDAAKVQIMYGVAGERILVERELDHLPGFASSVPVRVGNAASGQVQLDVYGELLDSFHLAAWTGLDGDVDAWHAQRMLLEHLASQWELPDEGLWEIRGPRRHFVHSKVMAWVAFDRAIDLVERYGFDGPVDEWRQLREAIHDQVCARGIDPDTGSFTQFYGSDGVDAALLHIPLTGFLPIDDERVQATIERIQRELAHPADPTLLRRYLVDADQVDGLPGDEGCFLACSFWLVDVLALAGRHEEGAEHLAHLVSLANDVGLLAEEYDPVAGCQLGNVPQAFSHLGLVNAAHALSERERSKPRRRTGEYGRAADRPTA
ncbi:MAG: glycoside hydrolase family 15 protein, partial [Ilumatobacteraceae bacterium]